MHPSSNILSTFAATLILFASPIVAQATGPRLSRLCRVGAAGSYEAYEHGVGTPINLKNPTLAGRPGDRLARPVIETTVDIVIYVEPGQGTVRYLKVRAYRSNPSTARMRTALVARGLFEEREREEDEKEVEKRGDGKPKKMVSNNGVPMRQGRGLVRTELDVTFDELGSASLPALDEQARRALGIEK